MTDLHSRGLTEISAALSRLGARQLFAKFLAPNDNSKNQPYLARGSLSVLNMFPITEAREESGAKRPNFKAKLPLYWLLPDGGLEAAPGSQLIVYPDYPEVRLSGFLRGTRNGPNNLMTTRIPNRVLLLAPTGDSRVIGLVLSPSSQAARELSARAHSFERIGVLCEIPLLGTASAKTRLLTALGELHRAEWCDPIRLTKDGMVPCKGTNCGGCTLEAMLGITSNSVSGPDFEGWEIKGHKTRSFSKLGTGQITLMTPAPTGGEYKSDWQGFVRKYGYADKKNPNRKNFSSPHRMGGRNKRTGLHFEINGYDSESLKIWDVNGYLALVTDDKVEAATWDFPSLMLKWNTKHSKAAFVPYMARGEALKQYAYGSEIQLGEGTDFRLFLHQFALGNVAYDPGIWVADGTPGHARSQFRIPARFVPNLYDTVSLAKVI